MSAHHFIIATAGHVDHGKSALVKALSGTDPDRLPEEKARGITIDLGFAHLTVSSEETPSASFDLGIVDVPGHEDFVKNMVAGVGSIDLALFVIAADDGWMPQTEEHLQILTYLGVTRAVVALTKIDLLESASEGIVSEIRAQLRDTPFVDAPIVGTSVVDGRGLGELKSTLARELAGIGPPHDVGKPRLPVDRVFTLRGIGTVVTGTLTGGVLRRGQTVAIQPSGRTTRIRSLQNHNATVEASTPGSRTAINLPDTPIALAPGMEGIRRGDVLTLPELGSVSKVLDVLLEKSGRQSKVRLPGSRPLKNAALVRVHLGSGNYPARLHFLDGNELIPGNRVIAQIRSETSIFAMIGDHFVVRDWQEQGTLAGGRVLNPDGNARLFRSPAQRAYLEKLAQSPITTRELISLQLARDKAARRAGLLLKSRSSATEIAEAVNELSRDGKAFIAGEWVADADWWRELLRSAAAAIDAKHRADPNQVGLALGELRALVGSKLPAAEIFEALVAELCGTDFAQAGVAIRRRSHRPTLPPHLEAAAGRLRAALGAKPFDPPSRKELAPDSTTHQALRFLLQSGEAVELGGDVVFLAEHFARATEVVTGLLSQSGPATVSEIRQAIGSSRRVVVPLLERLDRNGVTRREGDRRVLCVKQ
jgi:selenocysteine-specific elongation factor